MTFNIINLRLKRLQRRFERIFKKIYRPILMRKLRDINRRGSAKIIAEGGPIVSLTTFGQRIHTVFYTIETIGRGTLLPSRITLWVDSSIMAKPLPESLQRLQNRGLEICETEDLLSHKKYFPEVCSARDTEQPFVTADDDVFYAPYWLSLLYASYQQDPLSIHCFRAHRVEFDAAGGLIPYSRWPKCLNDQASHLHFATGVSGVLYPPIMRRALRDAGLTFRDYCLRADDIWLFAHALRTRTKVRQIFKVPKRFYEIPGTTSGALAEYNNGLGGNDAQLKATLTEDDLQFLREAKSAT